MLSKEENELLCRVGQGTPMGEVMRRYWLPALLSLELAAPDCAPVRLKLLGESLVAFRDTEGRVGILEEGCPHRLASLWLGRNEESGLRCVYHGWKFDVNGVCVDQMNEPNSFADKVKAVAYPTVEQGDVIWVYMGRPENRPPPPNFEYTQVPGAQRAVSKVWEECSWLQALEGGIDSSHAPILHRSFGTGAGGIAVGSAFVRGKAPTLEVDGTDYGYRYTGIRPLDEDQQYVRGYHFVMPFTQLRPGQNVGRDGSEKPMVAGHHWVPIDDHNCMVWNWHYSYDSNYQLSGDELTMDFSGNGPTHVNAQNEYRAYGNVRNDWLIDREVQKTQTFTGIPGINAQDRAVQESMGGIVDRSKEHLGPADRAVIAARKLLVDAVRDVQQGSQPLGVAPTYYSIRATERIFDAGIPWRERLLPEMYPEGERQVATAVV
jgi:phenylpropionate dioxygenase-like ring-hydroxylating dioxygenase large terminal subunit